MQSDLFHSQSNFKPRIIPLLGDTDWAQIDRAQTLDPDVTLTREKIEELGREDIVAWLKDIPTVGCRLVQREYGSIDLFRQLANKTSGSVSLGDFDNTAFDICAYLTDTNDAFISTLVYPKQRMVGFSITIGDPTALIDRSFDFTGESAKLWQGDNKYFIFKKKTVASGDLGSGNIVDITVSDPSAVENPDKAGEYILRVVRVRSGETEELTSDKFSYSAPTLTVEDCEIGDVIKYWYTASSWVSNPSAPFIENDSDLPAIRAHSASLYLKIGSSNYLYKLQSATIDVRFDREDVREIGNDEVVLRGVTNKTVTITLGRLLESEFTLEEVLRNVASGYGVIDIDKFSADITFICALYSDADKGTFKIGFKATKLTPSAFRPGTANINTHVDSGVTLEGEDLLITETIGELGI